MKTRRRYNKVELQRLKEAILTFFQNYEKENTFPEQGLGPTTPLECEVENSEEVFPILEELGYDGIIYFDKAFKDLKRDRLVGRMTIQRDVGVGKRYKEAVITISPKNARYAYLDNPDRGAEIYRK